MSQCSEGATTVINPTSFTLTTSEPGLTGTALTTLQTDLTSLGLSDVSSVISQLQNPTESVSFKLACSVNGTTVTTAAQTYNALPDNTTAHINLQPLVGSPVPNSCQVQDFTVKSLVSLSAVDLALINGLPSQILSTSTSVLGIPGLPATLGGIFSALGLGSFTGLSSSDLNDLLGLSVGATLTTSTSVPGAIWQEAAKTSGGLDADICADDAANGNAGAHANVFQCDSDLAQSWTQASTGRLVRNGDCLTETSGKVFLQKCSASAPTQVWNTGTGGSFNKIVNSSTHHCLTAPKALDGVQLTATACTGKANQLWKAPSKSAA